MSHLSRHSSWLTTALLTTALLGASAQAACISLSGSTTCPSFADFSIDTSIVTRLADHGIVLNPFTTLQEFDAAAMNATGFKTSRDCTSYTPSNRIPYQNTLLCTIAVWEAASVACKSNPPSMCATSCTLYKNGLETMINGTCPSSSVSREGLTELAGVCNHSTSGWAALQSNNTNCIDALKNEEATCGMGSPTARCNYCEKHRNEPCCANVSTCSFATTITTTTTGTATPSSTTSAGKPQATDGGSGLSKAALGGIIGGSVAFVVLALAACFFCMRRGKRAEGGHGKGGHHLARQISNSSGRYNISSPKIQEDGFSASIPIPMTTLPPIVPESNQFSSTAGPAIAAAGTVAGASVVGAGLGQGSGPGTALVGARGSMGEGGGKQSYCQALYPYQASMADELDLTPGDIINVQRVFDDGWAVGVNMNTSNEGAFPVVCVMFVDESALDDDFEEVNMHGMAPMTLREEDQEGRLSPSGRNSPRSSLPSRSSSPVHLPRRNSSIRDSTGTLQGLNMVASSPLAGGQSSNGRMTPTSGGTSW
ncbi:hypothetical protein BGZ94_004031 [Podila epigama]|nr:hypothetical protein BGZ94_004031 [Podila epigama]